MNRWLRCYNSVKRSILLSLQKQQKFLGMSMIGDVPFESNPDMASPRDQDKTNDAKAKRQKRKIEKKNKRHSDFPSHFLAVQISDPAVKGAMKAIQDVAVAKNELLSNVVVSVNTAHITLGLLYLPDEAAIKEAARVLNNCKSKFEESLEGQPLSLEVSGIGHFRESVVFAKLHLDKNEEKLKEIAGILDEEFQSLKCKKTFKYVPHITMMKLSKLRSSKLRKKLRRIDLRLFKSCDGIHFGSQLCDSVQLLSMYKKKNDNGYYHCETQTALNASLHEAEGYVSPSKSVDEYADFLSSYLVTSVLCNVSLCADGGSS